MKSRTLCAVAVAVGALATAMFSGAAAAATSAPCNASQTFAAYGDSSYYTQMQAVGSTGGVYTGSCTAYSLPSLRIVARNVGNPAATLRVSVQYRDATGSHDVTIGTVTGSGAWTPSQILRYSPLSQSGNLTVTLTPVGWGGSWQVGGVYLDPFCGR